MLALPAWRLSSLEETNNIINVFPHNAQLPSFLKSQNTKKCQMSESVQRIGCENVAHRVNFEIIILIITLPIHWPQMSKSYIKVCLHSPL